MPSQKPAHRLRNDKERHEAIKTLAEKRGFDSVSDYLNHLVDEDAKASNFELPPSTDHRIEPKLDDEQNA